jgi:hypothetical protein
MGEYKKFLFTLTDFSQLLLTYTTYFDGINMLVSICNASRNPFVTTYVQTHM